jgi:hypothetical protein
MYRYLLSVICLVPVPVLDAANYNVPVPAVGDLFGTGVPVRDAANYNVPVPAVGDLFGTAKFLELPPARLLNGIIPLAGKIFVLLK